MSILLETHALSKHFVPAPGLWQRLWGRTPKAVPVRAVEGVSFVLHRGEIFGLLGESGAGKSTLARLLLRLDVPTQGRVVFEQRDLDTLTTREVKASLRRRARMVFQHPDAALNPALTVERILDQALRTHTGLTPGARRARTTDLLEEVGLPPACRAAYPHALSAGEKRRVGIARAVATNPVLLVADEPVAGLDAIRQRRILELLWRLSAERGMTLLLIGHDVRVLHPLCDRLGVMFAGRLVEIGPRAAVAPGACRHPYPRVLFAARLRLSDPASPHPANDTPPAPASAVTGCPYRPACSRWRHLGQPALCVGKQPLLAPVGRDHRAACHFPDHGDTGPC